MRYTQTLKIDDYYNVTSQHAMQCDQDGNVIKTACPLDSDILLITKISMFGPDGFYKTAPILNFAEGISPIIMYQKGQHQEGIVCAEINKMPFRLMDRHRLNIPKKCSLTIFFEQIPMRDIL